MVPIMTVIAGFGFASFLIYLRYRRQKLLHAERLAAIEKNMPLPESFFAEPVPGARVYLLRGLVWLAVGIGISIFFAAMWLSERNDPEMLGAAAVGVIPALVGAAHLIYYRMEANRLATGPESSR